MPAIVLVAYLFLACWILWWVRRGMFREEPAFALAFLGLLVAAFAGLTWLLFCSPLLLV